LFLTKWSMAIFIAIVILAGNVLAVGQTERVVHRFQGGNGGFGPEDRLITDQAGNFYGITTKGGAHNNGTVFKLSKQNARWARTLLYAFNPFKGDVGSPSGKLIFDQKGNLYGVTVHEGSGASGMVFELTPQGSTWAETVIYRFPAKASPNGDLALDDAGNLYGATANGGQYGAGAVFELTPSQGGWTETTIYSFNPIHGGVFGPRLSGPIINSAGNLYGVVTWANKFNFNGAVYELKAPATQGGAWTERVLHRFQGSNDGSNPSGQLMFDGKGNLDGVTSAGGVSNEGEVFQLVRHGTSWTETVLYSFCSQSNCSDGAVPEAGLITDVKGNLYGTTTQGGIGIGNDSCGTVFQLTPPATQDGAWTETVLHAFTGGEADGCSPISPLVRGKFGGLWGMTYWGGDVTAACGTNGCGTAFSIFF
jgi:uncharacterized repeat protein (TIGR03803 family)